MASLERTVTRSAAAAIHPNVIQLLDSVAVTPDSQETPATVPVPMVATEMAAFFSALAHLWE